MTTLPEKIRKNRFEYTLVRRGQRSCIFCQEVTPAVTYFEVFLIRVRPARIIRIKRLEKQIPATEVFPANEDFGKTAWTLRDLKSAYQKFNELENHAATKGIL